MATTYKAAASLKVILNGKHVATDELGAVTDAVSSSHPYEFGNVVGGLQVDLHYRQTLGADATIDLAGFNDAFGNDRGFSSIKLLVIKNNATDAEDVIQLANVADFTSLTAGTQIAAGGILVITSPGEGMAVDVTSSFDIEGLGDNVLVDVYMAGIEHHH